MSQILSTLLNASEPKFSFGLSELEKLSGHNAVDINLVSDISAIVLNKIKELALDPKDTTGIELYHALQAMVSLHDKYLAQAIGTGSNEALDDQLKCISRTLENLAINKSCWTMKQSVAKKMLKASPPKKVMKILGYKSIDSILKRENICEIYAAIRFCESKQYQKNLISKYKKLRPSDFETRDIEFIYLDKAKWGNAADDFIFSKRHNITHLKELGVIMILPIPIKRLKGVVITILPLAIHYINDIRSYSAFFKLQQVNSDFGTTLVETILNDPKSNAKIAGHQLHWRIIQQHFGSNNNDNSELFEPHVQIEDLSWRKAEDVIYRIEPALKFWENLDYVARYDNGQVISFNLMDNAVSYCNSLEYGQQIANHFRESLWNEIYLRYMGQDSIEKIVLKQLNSQTISFETDII